MREEERERVREKDERICIRDTPLRDASNTKQICALRATYCDIVRYRKPRSCDPLLFWQQCTLVRSSRGM